MKQRIRAEAHGSSPSCRHRPQTEADTADLTSLYSPEAHTEPEIRLQR
jgi:hypothetical protein